MRRILLVGDGDQTIAAQAAILAKTGAGIICCTPAELTSLEHPRFDLVVLTATLKPAYQRVLAEYLSRRFPRVRVLHVLSGSTLLPSSQSQSTPVVKAKVGLIEKVIHLLAESHVGTLHIVRRTE